MDKQVSKLLEDFEVEIDSVQRNVNTLTHEVTKELDKEMEDLQEILNCGNDISDTILETAVLSLPATLYHTISKAERCITCEAIAKLAEKEKLNLSRKTASGTVAEKQSYIEQQAQQETLIRAIYSVVNKNIDRKIDCAKDMLNSVKKIMTLRLSEYELSNNKYGNRNRGE